MAQTVEDIIRRLYGYPQPSPMLPTHMEPQLPTHPQPQLPTSPQPMLPTHMMPQLPTHPNPQLPTHMQRTDLTPDDILRRLYSLFPQYSGWNQ